MEEEPKTRAVIIPASPANYVAAFATAATAATKPPSILKKAVGTSVALKKPTMIKNVKKAFLPSHWPNLSSKSLNPSIIGKVDFHEEPCKYETYVTVRFLYIKGILCPNLEIDFFTFLNV
jgi:hypothetical protein